MTTTKAAEDIQVGDTIIDGWGDHCKVTRITPLGVRAKDLAFMLDDGTEIFRQPNEKVQVV